MDILTEALNRELQHKVIILNELEALTLEAKVLSEILVKNHYQNITPFCQWLDTDRAKRYINKLNIPEHIKILNIYDLVVLPIPIDIFSVSSDGQVCRLNELQIDSLRMLDILNSLIDDEEIKIFQDMIKKKQEMILKLKILTVDVS